jgi:hypothetical protein
MIGSPMALVSERDQGVDPGFSADNNASAVATVSAARSPERDVLFAAKGHAAITTFARNDFDFNTIDKHSGCLQQVRGEDALVRQRLDVDPTAFSIEVHVAIDQSEDGVIGSHANIAAWMPFGPALADQDVAWTYEFAAEFLNSKTLCVRVASVPCGALSFFVCHGS